MSLACRAWEGVNYSSLSEKDSCLQHRGLYVCERARAGVRISVNDCVALEVSITDGPNKAQSDANGNVADVVTNTLTALEHKSSKLVYSLRNNSSRHSIQRSEEELLALVLDCAVCVYVCVCD